MRRELELEAEASAQLLQKAETFVREAMQAATNRSDVQVGGGRRCLCVSASFSACTHVAACTGNHIAPVVSRVLKSFRKFFMC